MKRFIKVAAVFLALGWTIGCTPKTTTPAQLAPGYNNQADQQMGEILSGAHAFYSRVQQDSASGAMVLTATEKQAFNAFGATLNGAQAVYLAYHNGTATQAQAQAAVSQVQTQQAALPTPGGK